MRRYWLCRLGLAEAGSTRCRTDAEVVLRIAGSEVKSISLEAVYLKILLKFLVEWWRGGESLETQIPPLRFASVGMTNVSLGSDDRVLRLCGCGARMAANYETRHFVGC